MPEDLMSPKERIGAFMAGKIIDRFPCVPLILNHAARIAGVKIGDYARNGKVMGDCHVKAYKLYGQDLITIFSDTAIIAEAMGTSLYYQEDDVPRVEKPVVANPNDLSKMTHAKPTDGRLPVYLEAIRTCVDAVGDEVMTTCCFSAPFTTAAGLRGTEYLARDLVRNKELAHKLLKISTEVCKDFTDAVIESGAIPVLVDPVATGSVLGERQFREFALPYLQELHAHIARRGMPIVLHICGQTTRILDAILDSSPAILSLDDISMTEARDRAGHRVTLMGNVRPAPTLLQGTPEDVMQEVRELCEIGRGCIRGFILGSGCEVPINAPVENVKVMMDGVRDFGTS